MRRRRTRRAKDVLVLCYHALDETWPAALCVTPDAFERQLDVLVERRYRAVTFAEAVLAPPGERAVAITFDDGLRSVKETAFPLLAQRGYVATVFVPTSFVGRDEPASWDGVSCWLRTEHAQKLQVLSQPELVQLAAAGWEIGSHTCTHPHLPQLGAGELADELAESKRRCSELIGRPCRTLAYPYGDFDERVRRAAEEAGYDAACSLPRRFARPTPLAWPRVGIWRDDTDRTFMLKISPPLRRLRATPLWHVADSVRGAAARLRARGG